MFSSTKNSIKCGSYSLLHKSQVSQKEDIYGDTSVNFALKHRRIQVQGQPALLWDSLKTQVNVTSPIKSLRKRLLPSIPTKSEWRAEEMTDPWRKTAWRQDWLAPGNRDASRSRCLGSCLQYLRPTNWKTLRPVSTLTLGLVISIKLEQQGNGTPPHFNNKGLKTVA